MVFWDPRHAGLAWLSRSRGLGYFHCATLHPGHTAGLPGAEWQMRLRANVCQMN